MPTQEEVAEMVKILLENDRDGWLTGTIPPEDVAREWLRHEIRPEQARAYIEKEAFTPIAVEEMIKNRITPDQAGIRLNITGSSRTIADLMSSEDLQPESVMIPTKMLFVCDEGHEWMFEREYNLIQWLAKGGLVNGHGYPVLPCPTCGCIAVYDKDHARHILHKHEGEYQV